MKIFRILIIGFTLGCIHPVVVNAAARRASSAGVGNILHYQTQMPEPRIHRELHTSQIESLSGFNRNGKWQNPGLTIGSHELKTNFQLGGTQFPGKSKVKVWLDSLEVSFRYTDLDVYVANDYEEGTCEAIQILKHEMQHVAVHRRLYAKYSAELKREILAMGIPTHSRPASYVSLSAAKNDLSSRLRAVTEGLYARFKRELSEQNNRLDTVANYRAVQGRCHHWK